MTSNSLDVNCNRLSVVRYKSRQLISWGNTGSQTVPLKQKDVQLLYFLISDSVPSLSPCIDPILRLRPPPGFKPVLHRSPCISTDESISCLFHDVAYRVFVCIGPSSNHFAFSDSITSYTPLGLHTPLGSYHLTRHQYLKPLKIYRAMIAQG